MRLDCAHRYCAKQAKDCRCFNFLNGGHPCPPDNNVFEKNVSEHDVSEQTELNQAEITQDADFVPSGNPEHRCT